MKKMIMVLFSALLSVSAFGQVTLLTESIGTVGGTTTIAAHETADGFDNDALTMSDGGTGTPADIRQTSVSSGYTGATGLANVFFTSTAGTRGFSISGIDASGHTSLNLSFGYRKESAAANATFSVEWSSDGTTWNTLTVNSLPAANAVVAWYLVDNISLPVGAEVSNLSIRWVKSGTLSLRVDDIKLTGVVPNSAPVASAVSFVGTLTEGELLTGIYSYSDTEDDLEGSSTFKWYASDDAGGLNKTAIGGATNSTFTLTASQIGKYISFAVTPVAESGTLTGSEVESGLSGAVSAAENSAPSISELFIAGTLVEGDTLSALYSYTDNELDAEGNSTFQWYRNDDEIGTGKSPISGADTSIYILTISDAGKYISVEVTPVASTGTTTGITAESGLVGPIDALPNDAPVASEVTFTGTLTVGQTLTGSYTYTDTENNAQGSSTFQWYRSDDNEGTNWAAIGGATASTYLLTASDLGKYISFEVTPVASIGTTTGTAVESSIQGPVAGIPTLSVIGTLTSFGIIPIETSSAIQSYKVKAVNLTTDLVITAPSEFMISTNIESEFGSTINLTPSSGTVDTTIIYVKFAPTSVGIKTGNITNASTGLTTQNVAVTGTSSVELPIYEDFDYTAGTILTSNGWAAHSGGGSNVITVGNGNNLSYFGYLSAVEGNAVTLATSGEDLNYTFIPQTSGSVYYSFLVNVATATTTGDYFANAMDNPANASILRGRVFVKDDGAGNLKFGLNLGSTAATLAYTTTTYSKNVTHLIVLKYTVNPGTLNDAVSLFINPVLNGSEPAADLTVSDALQSDLTNVGAFALRQGSSLNAATLTVDALRIETTWISDALPVELTSFTVNKSETGASLVWSTKTETNNYGFEVEKSADLASWTKIGFVAGKGTSTVSQSYSYADNKATGTVYYRLKQLDNNGGFHYTGVETITLTADKFEVVGNFPNPFNPTTKIAFNLPQDGKVRVSISNILGQEIAVLANGDFKAGANIQVPFNASKMTSGVYFYTVTANGKSVTKSMTLMK